jgi:uncharacterized protein YutE (UPF0331/DUF86 family)
MEERVKDKIEEIEEFASELDEITPENYEEYSKDNKTKAACERYFEKIIEAVVDLAFLIIKENKLKIPEEDKEAFDILAEEGIITNQLTQKLKDAKGMRNIIAHDYGKIDDEIIFNSITEEIQKDVSEFINELKHK